MNDVTWVLLAIAVACVALVARSRMRRRFSRHPLGRLAAELIGWNGYFLALAIGIIQTNGGWHAGRGTTVEIRSTWSEEGPWLFALACLLAIGTFLYTERTGRDWIAGEYVSPFPADYVQEILAAETQSTPQQCRAVARRLRRTSRKTGRSLPDPLAEFVSRHLDRP